MHMSAKGRCATTGEICRARSPCSQALHAPDPRLQGLAFARIILGGVELMHMSAKGRCATTGEVCPQRNNATYWRVTPTGSLTTGETVPPTFTRASLNATEPPYVPIWRALMTQHQRMVSSMLL